VASTGRHGRDRISAPVDLERALAQFNLALSNAASGKRVDENPAAAEPACACRWELWTAAVQTMIAMASRSVKATTADAQFRDAQSWQSREVSAAFPQPHHPCPKKQPPGQSRRPYHRCGHCRFYVAGVRRSQSRHGAPFMANAPTLSGFQMFSELGGGRARCLWATRRAAIPAGAGALSAGPFLRDTLP
jgi:hypothetical protein